MSNQNLRLAIVLVVGLIPSVASAQHGGHQPAAMQAPSADLTQCLRVQPVIENVVTTAMARAEAARLSNSPSELRAAVEHLEAALRDIRAQSAPCAAAAASLDPHAGHSSAQPVDKQTDPVNGMTVDPMTAPKTTYQGQTYYFSSEETRKEFLTNPAKFAKKPKG